MKKLVLTLFALLLLTGCGRPEAPEQTAEPTESAVTEPTETEPAGLYLPESPMERATEGAIRTYELESGHVTGLSMLGEHLLVASDGRTLHLLEGERAIPIRTREPEVDGSDTAGGLQQTAMGAGYYDSHLGAFVTLDENLIGGPSYELPGASRETPVAARDLSVLYYVTDGGIGAMDLQQGTTRMLRKEPGEILRLDGLLFESSLLQYTRLDADGLEQVCFIDPRTGSMVDTVRFAGQLHADGDRFGALMEVESAMGAEPWILTGTRQGAESRLIPAEGWGDPIFLSGGWILLQQQTRVGLELACMELSTGAQLGRVVMPQYDTPVTLAAADGDALWLSDGESGRFYRWTLTSGGQEPAAEMVPYFSLSQPDETAMEALNGRMEELEERFGIRLSVKPAQARTEGVSYDRMPDYLPAQSARALDALEQTLSRLPEGFLRTVGKKLGGRIRVELTDRYDPAWPAAAGTGSIDLTGGDARILVDMSADLEPVFYHELWHLMEVHIRNESDVLNRWGRLNPRGFDYTGTVETDPETYAGATADGYGMVSAREDRAQTFAYACMEDEADRFTQPVLQEKLAFLAQRLQDYFDPGDDPVWEQYLRTE